MVRSPTPPTVPVNVAAVPAVVNVLAALTLIVRAEEVWEGLRAEVCAEDLLAGVAARGVLRLCAKASVVEKATTKSASASVNARALR